MAPDRTYQGLPLKVYQAPTFQGGFELHAAKPSAEESGGQSPPGGLEVGVPHELVAQVGEEERLQVPGKVRAGQAQSQVNVQKMLM